MSKRVTQVVVLIVATGCASTPVPPPHGVSPARNAAGVVDSAAAAGWYVQVRTDADQTFTGRILRSERGEFSISDDVVRISAVTRISCLQSRSTKTTAGGILVSGLAGAGAGIVFNLIRTYVRDGRYDAGRETGAAAVGAMIGIGAASFLAAKQPRWAELWPEHEGQCASEKDASSSGQDETP